MDKQEKQEIKDKINEGIDHSDGKNVWKGIKELIKKQNE